MQGLRVLGGRMFAAAQAMMKVSVQTLMGWTTLHILMIFAHAEKGETIMRLIDAVTLAQENERRQRLGIPTVNDDISNVSTLHYQQGGDASG